MNIFSGPCLSIDVVAPGRGDIFASLTLVISQGVNIDISERNHIPDIIAYWLLTPSKAL